MFYFLDSLRAPPRYFANFSRLWNAVGQKCCSAMISSTVCPRILSYVINVYENGQVAQRFFYYTFRTYYMKYVRTYISIGLQSDTTIHLKNHITITSPGSLEDPLTPLYEVKNNILFKLRVLKKISFSIYNLLGINFLLLQKSLKSYNPYN